MSAARLERQIAFLLAADGLKSVLRQNRLLDGSRRENAAEHSWHLGLMALLFAEHAPEGTDLARVQAMLAVHDVVEVLAGDHWMLEAEAAAVAAKEQAAADRLFALLPPDQAQALRALWDEFEAQETAAARFARALDVLHPMLLAWGPGAKREDYPPISVARLEALKRPHLEPFPALWELARGLLAGGLARGALLP